MPLFTPSVDGISSTQSAGPPKTSDAAAPSSTSSGGIVAYTQPKDMSAFPVPPASKKGAIIPPASSQINGNQERRVALELQDGTVYQGYSFGAEKSFAGELVFQTGMVGYPESITDPSYRGQILVITFPLVGNYGVPSRETTDELLRTLSKHFESSQVHIGGLVVASYCGEGYSHFLAESSLGQWLKEQGVPAVHGVDTRALTKLIREEGSMLGRLLLQKPNTDIALFDNGQQSNDAVVGTASQSWRSFYENVEWDNPNQRNLVSEGKISIYLPLSFFVGPNVKTKS